MKTKYFAQRSTSIPIKNEDSLVSYKLTKSMKTSYKNTFLSLSEMFEYLKIVSLHRLRSKVATFPIYFISLSKTMCKHPSSNLT